MKISNLFGDLALMNRHGNCSEIPLMNNVDVQNGSYGSQKEKQKKSFLTIWEALALVKSCMTSRSLSAFKKS